MSAPLVPTAGRAARVSLLGAALALTPASASAETKAPGGAEAQAPALPPGVTLLPRAEVPWAVAAVALPFEAAPAPEAFVLAALLDEEATWRGTAPGALLEAGGRLEARLTPDGLVLVVEGPSGALPAVLDAALALTREKLRPDALARAQARALRRRVLDEADLEKRARSALWRAWYGEGAPEEAFVADEMHLIRMKLPALDALHATLAGRPGQALFVEGRVEPAPLAALRFPGGAALAPATSATATSATTTGATTTSATATGATATGTAARAWGPRLPVPGPARVVLEHPTAARRLVLGHPLPPAPELDGPFGEALLEALRPALAAPPLAGATVALSHHRGASLLVFDVPLEDKDPDAAEAALKAALEALRKSPPVPRALAPLLERGRAKQARAYAVLGERAKARALRHLRFGDAPVGPETPEALRELLRLALLPEALRGVLVERPAEP